MFDKNLFSFGINNRENDITIDELDENLCTFKKDEQVIKAFTPGEIVSTINGCTFALLAMKRSKIIAFISVTAYGNMWEIQHICGSSNERGLGGKLLDKLIEITQIYTKPIVLYGLGIKEGSRMLYLKKGFKLIDGSYQLTLN
jgi:hypothetical protein